MSTLLQSSSGTLAQIQVKTNSLALLADIVRQICPDLPEDAWHIANFQQNTLIIAVKSPVWGQRLQFERNKICQSLTQATQGQFQKIEIKVNPITQKKAIGKQTQINSQSPISTNTAKQLTEIAKNAPKGLKEKLLKLARHANK